MTDKKVTYTDNNFVGAVLAFIPGLVIAFCNFRLTEFFIKKFREKFPLVSLIRQFGQVVYLVAVFFLAPYTPWDRTYLLAGAALGVTIPMFFFTYKLLKGNSKDILKDEKKEDDADG